MLSRSATVQQRLTALVVLEAGSAILLLVLAFSGLGRVVSHTRYVQRFILEPLSAIGSAIEENAHLHKGVVSPDRSLQDIRRFAARYRGEWQSSGSSNPDALRQLDELRRAGALELADEERGAVDDLSAATERLASDFRADAPADVIERHGSEQRDALDRLAHVNLRFGRIASEASAAITEETYRMMAAVGVLAIAAAVLLGLRVRNAIVPRIARLVAKVRRFQDFGVNEPIVEVSKDELTMLGYALDVGFRAIAARDRDRDQFIAVMAHELKTPLSNIRGFAHAALEHPDREEIRQRAVEIISRQSDRVVRLVDDLFLVSRAHAHELPFEPRPLALTPLVERVAAEVRSYESGPLTVDGDVATAVLGDATLLSQAVWTMLTYAVRRAGTSTERLHVRVAAAPAEISTMIEGFGSEFSADELARLFEPFSSVEYEPASGGGARNVLGLYLCQEIAKVHGGLMRAFNEPDGTPALRLSLPV